MTSSRTALFRHVLIALAVAIALPATPGACTAQIIVDQSIPGETIVVDEVEGVFPPPNVETPLEVAAAPADLPRPSSKIKNVILMIGDGMGPQQVGLLSLFSRHSPHSTAPNRVSAIEQLMNDGVVGVVANDPHGVLVVDSAAAATQLATGQYAGSEMIGVNYQGEPAETIVEVAHKLGKSAGLVSDTRVTHATPAGFAAHQRHRSMENEIAVDMLANKVDVMLSGGLRHWVPASVNKKDSTTAAALLQMTGGIFPCTSKRTDEKNLLLEARGDYSLVFDRYALKRVSSGKVLGLFADSEMHDALLERAELNSDARTQPTLVEMSTKAIDLLSQDPDGFFLMIEGGQIDWAGHNNDAGTMLHELIRFDKAVQSVMDWARNRDDTVVIVTADHETGGFGFSYSGRPLPAPRRLPGAAFADKAPYAPNFNFATHEAIELLYGQEKSYYTLLILEFDKLPVEQRTPEKLVDMFNSMSPAKITLQDAVDVLTVAPNQSYVKGHPYLGHKTTPAIHDFEAFIIYADNGRMNLLGRKVATAQNVTWSTGSHTSTPVLVGAWGPQPALKAFTGVMHQTDLGERMIELVRAGEIAAPVAAREP